MKVFIAGASGRVGTKLTHNLIKDGHEVIAGVRNIEKVVKNDHVIPVKFELHESVTEMAQTIGKVDAIYFTAGSGAKDLLQADAFGAIKLMQVAAQNGIKRFIMLSVLFSIEPSRWRTSKGLDGLTDYDIAKFFADNYLTHTTLDYTILQPTVMTDKSGTGKITVDDSEFGYNPASEILKYQNTKRKIIKMREGSTPIDEALSRI